MTRLLELVLTSRKVIAQYRACLGFGKLRTASGVIRMKVRHASFVIALGLIVACSSSPSTTSDRSCSQTSGGVSFCADYNANVSTDNARAACSGASGSFSTSACTSTNRIGRCVAPGMIGGTQTNSTLNFYVPTTDSDARQVCTALNGTYTSG